ncbi:DNA methyltransferase [Tepidimonas aquatica]|uniref:site-specific DNA-methyltransferase (adenine-specific) n=1 Tax=Tepidimonas aquatica TaxID=247482 RepID=A0A554W902_9BURK|nr:DNA methyltransferase [Tepidimonas aquatica]TSE20049.1 DNA methylase [Tepidimonas aquatica]
MSQKYEKLKTLLKELFQLDQPELDFGIYRIMHARSAEVTQFLDKDLLPQVKQAFAQYRTADKAELEKELAKAIEAAQALGVDPESTQKVKDLRARLASEAVDTGALEAEVYDHLYSFFRRYYSEGDFLSKRVYKPGVYAIPYEGEEVKLHWANADQYYIKTSEYLRDYAFRLRPEDEANPMRVHFKLVDAAEGEHGNVKEQAGKERRFVLAPTDFLKEVHDGSSGELEIRFEYRPVSIADWPEERRIEEEKKEKPKPPSQDDLVGYAVERILAALKERGLQDWLQQLAQPAPTEKNKERTLLQKHLEQYVKRNTFDYFIHKDLGGFLRRELDFYIKNEVMHLDDVESETAPRVEQYLSKIKVIRRIAHKIIDFLAQLEDFQKKLWLKKKFVVETSYCIRLGVIPEEFYPEIAANDAQREEWVRLCAIDEIKGDLTTPGYSVPLTVGFLRAQPTLMVDTKNFSVAFVDRLLDVATDEVEESDGILIHGENAHALSLLSKAFSRRVEITYIDPPYNTEHDRATGKFLYKDNYDHSSWLTMISERLDRWRPLLSETGAFFMSIDDNELHRSVSLLEEKNLTLHGLLTWRRTRTGGHLSNVFNQLSDYVIVATAPDGQYLFGGQADPEESQPLSKATNQIKQLVFPPGSIEFLDCERGLVKSGTMGASSAPVQVVHDFEIVDGKNATTTTLEGPFVWTQSKLESELENGARIIIKRLHNLNPRFLRQPTTHKPLPSLADEQFVVGTNEDGSAALDALFGSSHAASYPKPVRLAERVVASKSYFVRDLWALDFFGGSGTTAHAIINLNREDGGQRKFILVEQADYFDTVLLPRLKKVTFTPEWKDGKPKRFATAEEAERSPRIMKVIRLESYEDALNNLELRRSEAQQSLLDSPQAQGADGFREQYLLRYMLDVETRGSQSLLNVSAFMDPTAYRLKVKRPGSDESREVNVDLLETFNWLIGLKVDHIAAPRTYSAAFRRDADPDLPADAPRRLLLDGRLKEDPEGPWWFRTVTGTTPDGRRTLVIWRKRPGGEAPEGIERDNLVLDEWFRKQGYSSKDSEFDLIYVNGDNNLENLKAPDDTWKVRLIEEDFFRLMFDTEGV